MSKLERYSSYKESGVEWLGEIPEGWEVQKIKYLFKENSIKNHSEETPLAATQLYGVVPKVSLNFRTVEANISDLNIFKLVQENNFVISLRSFEGGIEYSEHRGIISPAYTVMETIENIDYIYYKYLFKSNIFIQALNIYKTGIREGQNISFSKLRDDILPFPPKQEQIKIASYLDTKTEQLDKAIKQKEQLIALLKERRQILINDAVTKGIDKTVAMKDSGVEWIGEIPEHWEVKKLKYVVKSKLKYGANESGIEYDESLPRYVRITDFSDSGKLSEKNKLSLTWETGKEYLLKDGDILFARSGATVGKTYQFKKSMSSEKFYSFAGYLIKAESNEEIVFSDYVYLYTNSDLFASWKQHIFNKATIENIGADKYSELFITIPSIKEQEKILNEFNIDGTKIDKAIDLQQQQITKLKEYKTTLIDSVVTGKVRVA